MNTDGNGKRLIAEQWRELGFFYDVRDDEKKWYLVGSRNGLTNFYNILVAYANNSVFEQISAHEHYGPYKYLEIMTWTKSNIDEHAIQGRREDLLRLSELFYTKLMGTPAGQNFIISQEYSKDAEYSLFIKVKDDNFDPSVMDTNIIGC